jgi:hypothetical protein
MVTSVTKDQEKKVNPFAAEQSLKMHVFTLDFIIA